MFEIGFSEIVVIMVVALIVIGPERLPKVARTLGLLWGRAQRYVNGVRADIERDMQLEELRQLKQKVEQEAMSVEQSARQSLQSLDQQTQSLAKAIETSADSGNLPKAAKPEEFHGENLKEGQEVKVSNPITKQTEAASSEQLMESKPRSVPVTTSVNKPKESAAPIQQQFPID